MRVCDRCMKGEVTSSIQIDNKDFEVCANCIGKIKKFLETKPKGLYDMFKQ